MGFWGAVAGGAVGFLVGGPVGAAVGAGVGYGIEESTESSSSVTYGTPVDYSIAMMYQSDNNKTTALAQIHAQEFAMQMSSLDREMQLAAQLELNIEKLDTRLQEALLQYRMQMTAEENQHVERMAEIKQKHGRIESGGAPAFSTDLPPPDFL
jgi:hypothetical protein